jgi:FlaA1/EpsC-like NDP-sugar epimerase
VIKEKGVQEVVFCMPTAAKSVFRRVAADCAALGIPTSSVPSLSEIILGKVKVSQLRPVRMEDLLGRASVEFASNDYELLEAYSGRRILVTGAAGSIGSELVRQLKEFNPTKLILLDKDENGLYETGLEIREDFGGEVVGIVADIRNHNRLEKVFCRWRRKTGPLWRAGWSHETS